MTDKNATALANSSYSAANSRKYALAFTIAVLAGILNGWMSLLG